jgi:hypothetical protein
MTKEEFGKIKFKCAGHISLEGEHQISYYNDQYGISMIEVTKMKRDGFEVGKSHKEYYYKGKWYRKLDKFLWAIKDVEYINK